MAYLQVRRLSALLCMPSGNPDDLKFAVHHRLLHCAARLCGLCTWAEVFLRPACWPAIGVHG